MVIWIDNDGCPRAARDVVFNAAQRRGHRVIVVGNSWMNVPNLTGKDGSKIIEMIVVEGGFDKADDYIAENVNSGDLVITADVPLAARIVAKNAVGISPRGEVFDTRNVADKLATRNLLAELRGAGEVRGGPAPFGEADKRAFANTLDKFMARLANQTI